MSVFDRDSISTTVSVEGVDASIQKMDQLSESQKRILERHKETRDELVKSIQTVKQQEAAVTDGTEANKQYASTTAEVAAKWAIAGTAGLVFVGIAKHVTESLIDKTLAAKALGEEVNRLSERTGLSAGQLQRLGYAAAQANTDMRTVASAVEHLNDKLFRARSEDPNANRALKHVLTSIGIDPSTIKDGEDALLKVGDAMNKFRPEDRTSIAKALGISPELIQLLRQGSDEIKRQGEEFQKMSPLTAEAAKASDEWSSAMVRMKQNAAGTGRYIWNEIGPSLVDLIQKFNDASIAAGNMFKGAADVIQYGLPGSDRYVKNLTDIGEKIKTAKEQLARFDAAPAISLSGDSKLSLGPLSGGLLREQIKNWEMEQARLLKGQYIFGSRAYAEAQAGQRDAMAKQTLPGLTPRPLKGGGEERDPDDELRKIIAKLKIAALVAAGELDDSPEAKQWYSSIESILAPGKKYSEQLKIQAAQEAAGVFYAQRTKRMNELAQKSAMDNASAAWAAYEEGAELERTIMLKQIADRKRADDELRKLNESADPILEYVNRLRDARKMYADNKIILTGEQDIQLQKNVSESVKGLKQEAKDANEEIKGLLQDIAGFGRQFSDKLVEDLSKGGNAFKIFAADIIKLGLKRILFDAVGKPINDLLVSLVKMGAEGSSGGGIGAILNALFGIGSSPSGIPSDVGVMPSARGNIMGMGSVTTVGEQGVEMAYIGPTGTQIMPLDTGGRSTGLNSSGGLTLNLYMDSATNQAYVKDMVRRGVIEGNRAIREEAMSGGPMAKAVGKG